MFFVATAVAAFLLWEGGGRVDLAELHVLVNSTQRKITKQVNQHLTLLHTNSPRFALKSCYKFLIPLMEKYNFTLLAFVINFL